MKAYTNGKIFDGEQIIEGQSVLTDHGKVMGIVAMATIPTHAEQIDLQGHLLAPAFMDLQIYGGNGHLFGEFPSVEALEATYAYCLSGGTTHFMPTVGTHSEEVMLAAIEAVKAYWKQGGKGVLGLHLEGPYISVEKRGAHLQEYIRVPTLEMIAKWLSPGRDVVKMMTLAPEVCSADVLKFLLKQNIVVSAGHSNATYAQATLAFQKGIKVATHLFNAMTPLQHRLPGVVGAILDSPDVVASMVADGYHVDFAAIRISKKILGERLFLITDAVTENRKGRYSHRLQGDKYVIADGTLSGSSLTMLRAVRNCVEKVGIPLEEALRMASLYPARIMGLDYELGKIKPGFAENFVILDDKLTLKFLVEGRA